MGKDINVTRDDGEELAEIDPVCKMRVLPSRAAATHYWKGNNYYFCNPRCKEKFAAAPSTYISANTTKPGSGTSSLAPSGHPDSDKSATSDLKTFYLPESAFEYTCPMDPEVRQKAPGSCPKCGMALEAAISLNTDEHGSAEIDDLKLRLIPSTILTVILFCMTMPMMFGYQTTNAAFGGLPEPVNSFVQLVLASPVVLWGGIPIFRKAWSALKMKQLNMFSLIAFGVSISFGVSLFQLCMLWQTSTQNGMAPMLYFESAASIVTLVLLGQILELKARGKSNNALEALFALAPSKARKQISGEWREINVNDVKPGDRLRILPGDKVPADGVILSGESALDESLLSGNSLPQNKASGQRVYAGTINGDGQIVIEAESLGRDTVFAQIVDLLSQAHGSRSPIQEIADKASSIFIPTVILIAVATFISWLLLGGTDGMHHAVQNAVAVLVIACPCALGLATPLAVSAAVAQAARLGLLVKDARALEGLANATDMLIDKTGTLTQGRFEIGKIIAATEKLNSEDLLRLAASLEQASTHPLGISICKSASERKISLLAAENVKNRPGLGMEGLVDGKNLSLGNSKLMRETGIADSEFQNEDALSEGTVVFLSVERELVAKFVLVDKLKPEAHQFVEELRQLAVVPHIVSGDDKSSVSSTGIELKIPISEQASGLMPADKVALVEKLKSNKRTVAFLGDGINDAAALASANAGIAMATGSDVAISSAAISAMHGDLLAVSNGIRLAKKMTIIMKQNLVLAFAYNVVALVLATGALYPSFGIELNPAIAAGAMSLSSISVILNSLRLNRGEK